jgi:hypothetical protein
MTKRNIKRPREGGICRVCQHDLLARADGYVYCTKKSCQHHEEPHPTKNKLNAPEE